MWLLLILAIVVLGAGAYAFRVPLLSKLTGQSPQRIERHLNRRKQLR